MEEEKYFAILKLLFRFFYLGFMQFYALTENAWFILFATVVQKLPALGRLLYGGYEIRT